MREDGEGNPASDPIRRGVIHPVSTKNTRDEVNSHQRHFRGFPNRLAVYPIPFADFITRPIYERHSGDSRPMFVQREFPREHYEISLGQTTHLGLGPLCQPSARNHGLLARSRPAPRANAATRRRPSDSPRSDCWSLSRRPRCSRHPCSMRSCRSSRRR